LLNAVRALAKLTLTAAARSDLADIDEWDYHQFGKEVADDYSRKLNSAFDQLANHPLSGRATPEYGKTYRCLTHSKHRILYRVNNDVVCIIRILHHAMDAKRALGG
jgi:toxin ParE1/3/4